MMLFRTGSLAVLILLPLFNCTIYTLVSASPEAKNISNHTVNYAVIVSTSRYYHNYRHVTNALTIYNVLRQENVPDSHIILMLADDIPCNARNPTPNSITCQNNNLFASAEVDYRGSDVNVANFIRVLTGRHLNGTPSNRRLPYHSNDGGRANILVYLTGHGGDQFIKFQDVEEITSKELAQTFAHMSSLKRYNEVLFIADTCQAFTLFDNIVAKNVISIGSSLRGENSYGHHVDYHLGVAVIDSFTHAFSSFTKTTPSWQNRSIKDWIDTAVYAKLHSNVGFTDSTSQRKIQTIPMADFFSMKQTQTPGVLCREKDTMIRYKKEILSSSQKISSKSDGSKFNDGYHLVANSSFNAIFLLAANNDDMVVTGRTNSNKMEECSASCNFPFLNNIKCVGRSDVFVEFCLWEMLTMLGGLFVMTVVLVVGVLIMIIGDDRVCDENHRDDECWNSTK